MRTLSRVSRLFAAAAAVMAAALVIGGSFYVGFVGEVQRGLNNPDSINHKAMAKIAHLEQVLGYQGYLRAYRSFRLTGDVNAREQMTQGAMEATRALDALRALLSGTPNANLAIEDIESVVGEFARIARSAPETPAAALRGSASMDAIEAMPQIPQLEATYLTLRTALERLRNQAGSHQMGSVAWALTWSQMLIVCAFAALVLALIATAGLLQIGITRPLRSLTSSLQAVSSGAVNQPVWGTDRSDEIGDMARAGEKLRQSLTETEALRDLSRKGQLNIHIEGEASTLLGEAVAEVIATVNGATDSLKRAAEGIEETRAAQVTATTQQTADIAGVTSRLDAFVTGLDQASRQSSAAAAQRLAQLDTVAADLGEKGREISKAFDTIRTRTDHAVDGLTSSISAFGNAADSVKAIQGAFFDSCDRISADAATTAGSLQSLAGMLTDMVSQAGPRLLTGTPAATDEMDPILRLFRDDEPAERIATLLADRLAPNKALMKQIEAMRSDIRELALRMTEERILMTAEMPAPALAAEAPLLQAKAHRTLADVPAEEIRERLRLLSDEMAHAPTGTGDEPPGLTQVLRAFALRMKPLAAATEDTETLRNMAPELAEHAHTIEQGAREVAHAAALRAELDAITSELRALATAAQSAGAGSTDDLRETALHLGARAETLFSYLSNRQSEETRPAVAATPAAAFLHATATVNDLSAAEEDLSTLARIIGSLERRTAQLSDEAVAANLVLQTEGKGPDAAISDVGSLTDPDATIALVFDAVERLNNIAAALARAAEANRMRAAASA